MLLLCNTGIAMTSKPRVILPIAAAVAALSTTPSEPASATVNVDDGTTLSGQPAIAAEANGDKANFVYPMGEDLLGLIVTRQEDGTVVAQHASHVSHSSHASHHSHYSSR